MNRETVRRKLQRQVGRLTEKEWAFLVDRDYIKDITDGRSIETLADEVQTFREVFGRTTGSPQLLSGEPFLPGGPSGMSAFSERDRAISTVVSHYVNLHDESVRAFRESELDGRLLRSNRVAGWLKRYRPTKGGRGHPRLTEWPDDRLRKLADRLELLYRWHPVQAERFVLTNETPRVFSIWSGMRTRVSLPVLSRVELSVDPMVAPQELARHYDGLRRIMLHPGARKRPRPRRQSDRQVKLAAFVYTRPEDERGKVTFDRWNKTHRTERYSELSNFIRDAQLAVDRLLWPSA